MIENNITRKIEATTDQIIRTFFFETHLYSLTNGRICLELNEMAVKRVLPHSIIHLHTWKQPVRETSASSLFESVLPPPLCQRIIDTKWHTSLHISTNSPWLLQLSQMAVRAKICTVFRKWGILQPRSISQYHEPVRPIRNLSTVCYRITLSIRNTILVS